MTRKLFGTDGIRGLANKFPMNSEIASKWAWRPDASSPLAITPIAW